MIKSAMDKEKQIKFSSQEFSNSPTTSAGALVPINWPGQGIKAYSEDETNSTQGERIGNKIELQWLDFNFTANCSDNDESPFNNLRVILFQWLVPLDVSEEVPITGDILQTAGSSYPYICPLNYENRSKYKILMDETYTLTQGASSGTIVKRRRFKQSELYKDIKFIGDSEVGQTAAIIKGSIWLLLYSDALLLTPDFYCSTTLYYTD
jgi:hypothetical protein